MFPKSLVKRWCVVLNLLGLITFLPLVGSQGSLNEFVLFGILGGVVMIYLSFRPSHQSGREIFLLLGSCIFSANLISTSINLLKDHGPPLGQVHGIPLKPSLLAAISGLFAAPLIAIAVLLGYLAFSIFAKKDYKQD